MQNTDEHDAPNSRGFRWQSLGAMRRTHEHDALNSRGCPPAKSGAVQLASMHDASNSRRLSIGKVWGHAEVASGRVLCSPEHHDKALVDM